MKSVKKLVKPEIRKGDVKNPRQGKKFTAMPKNLFDLGEGYKAMVRELAKR